MHKENTSKLSRNIQSIQAEQYSFPYHYIPQVTPKLFLSRHWGFAASYVAALQLISNHLSYLFSKSGTHQYSHLDIGCGDGALLSYLDTYFHDRHIRLSGIDLDKRSIAWGELFNPGMQLKVCDVEEVVEQYDSISLIEVIEHIPPNQINLFIQSAAKLLKQNGNLILTVPSTEKPQADKHFRHFTFESVLSVLENEFKEINVSGFERSSLMVRIINKIQSNFLFKLDSPVLNKTLVSLLKKTYPKQEKCGRLFVTCVIK